MTRSRRCERVWGIFLGSWAFSQSRWRRRKWKARIPKWGVLLGVTYSRGGVDWPSGGSSNPSFRVHVGPQPFVLRVACYICPLIPTSIYAHLWRLMYRTEWNRFLHLFPSRCAPAATMSQFPPRPRRHNDQSRTCRMAKKMHPPCRFCCSTRTGFKQLSKKTTPRGGSRS